MAEPSRWAAAFWVSPVVVVRGGWVVWVGGRVVVPEPPESPDVVGAVVPSVLPPFVLGVVVSTVVSG